MATGIEKILEKTGLKAKDINAKNYEKLKFMLSDEDIKIVEKKLGVDKIAEAGSDKKLQTKISIEFGDPVKRGKVKDKGPNPGDAGGKIVKLAKGGFPDLSGDGEVTQKDILMGKGVIKMKKGGIVKKKSSRTRIAKRGFGIAKRGY